MGKRTFAEAFANALLCEKKDSNQVPCYHCTPCKLFQSGAYDDFMLIETKTKSISVEEIRKIIEWTAIRPMYAMKKIYLIVGAEKMTIQAQNALLKTLEEPPDYISAILTVTNPEALLETIKSRSVIYQFSQYSNHEIRQIVEANNQDTGPSEQKIHFLINLADGIPGKAIELLLSSDFFEIRDKTIDLFASLMEGDAKALFRMTEFFEKNKDNFAQIAAIIMYWLRDLWIFSVTGNEQLLINSDKKDMMHAYRKQQDVLALMDCIEYLDNIDTAISSNVNYSLAIHVLLLKINRLREVNQER